MLRKLLKNTFVRYLIAGGISVAADYGTLLLFYYGFDLDLGVATTIGFLVGLVVSFLLNKLWAFQAAGGAKQTTEQAIKVAVLVVFNLAVTNIAIVYLNKISIGPEISKILTTLMITLWNYILYKKHIFKREEEPIV